MSAITASDLSAAYKKLYVGQTLQSLVFDEVARPFLSRIKKRTDFQGDKYPMPVMYDDVGGGSNTFTTAQSNVAAMALKTFEIDVKKYYRVQQIETLALRKARSNLGSFLSREKLRTDSMLNALSNDLEKSLFRNASGYLGRVDASTTLSTLTIILSNKGDAKNFQIGDKIVSATGVDQALSGDPLTVSARSLTDGTLTVTGAASLTAASWALNDYIWRQGDYVSAEDTLHIHGLEDWIPSTRPTSGDSFFGVDRSSDPDKLAGIYYSTGSLSDIENSIIKAAATMADFIGARPDIMLCDYTLWGLLAKEMGIQVRRKPGEGKGGFESFYVMGPRSAIEIVPATFCQANTGWILEMSTWELISAGEPVSIWQDDGQLAVRVYNADAIEIRANAYPELGCYKPARNCRILFS